MREDIEPWKLRIDHSSTRLQAIGMSWEPLGCPDGQHNVRVRDQWRIRFVRHDSDAWDAEIVDHHQETN